MRNWIFRQVIKYVQNLSPFDYERFFTCIERPEFCRFKPLPKSQGRNIMFNYVPLVAPKPEGVNPQGPRFL